MLWEKPATSDDEYTRLKKKAFNKALKEDIISIIYAPQGFPFAFEEERESKLLAQNLQYADFSYDKNLDWLPFKINIRGANFTGSELDFLNFTNNNLSASNFSNAKLNWIVFTGTNLTNSDFRKAKFEQGDLNDATIVGANFSEAVFNYTELRNVNFKDVNLTNADLTLSKGLEAGSLLFASHLAGIKLPTSLDFSFMNLSELNLYNVSMRWVKLDKAYLANTNLTNADLHQATACEADFSGANLSGADLKESFLYNSNVTVRPTTPSAKIGAH